MTRLTDLLVANLEVALIILGLQVWPMRERRQRPVYRQVDES